MSFASNEVVGLADYTLLSVQRTRGGRDNARVSAVAWMISRGKGKLPVGEWKRGPNRRPEP